MLPQMAPLKVAIIGGGVGSATLAAGLLKHPNIDFHIYEAGPEIKEAGTAFTISPNARDALEVIGLNPSKLLEAAGAVEARESRLYMGEGPDAGTFVCDLGGTQRGVHLSRALFLSELLSKLPASRLHVNKKLVGADPIPATSQIELIFDDGSTTQVHAVIGSDGVRSRVRRMVVGGSQSNDPQWAGFWDVRGVVPRAYAASHGLIGDDTANETAYIGDGSFVLQQVIDGGDGVAIIAAGIADNSWNSTRAHKKMTRDELLGWLGQRGDFGTAVVDALLQGHAQADISANLQFESPFAATYANGPICLMGDAAHCATPWQGSGAGMAIEDAMVLESLLGRVRSAADIRVAFRAYDEVRRPRTQRVMQTSREMGLAVCGQHPRFKLDVERFRKSLSKKWDFIHSLDVRQHLVDAAAAYERLSEDD